MLAKKHAAAEESRASVTELGKNISTAAITEASLLFCVPVNTLKQESGPPPHLTASQHKHLPSILVESLQSSHLLAYVREDELYFCMLNSKKMLLNHNLTTV